MDTEDIILRYSDGTEESHKIGFQHSGAQHPCAQREFPTEHDYKSEQWERESADSNVFILRRTAGKARLTGVDCYPLPTR